MEYHLSFELNADKTFSRSLQMQPPQYILDSAIPCDFWLALFPPYLVRKPRRRYGVAYVFCLVGQKNRNAKISYGVTEFSIVMPNLTLNALS